MREELSFFKKPEPISEIAEVKDYDVVVVGAGSPGIPCAFRAAELGAKVAILQKLKTAMAGGNVGTGIRLEASDPYDVERLVNNMVKASDHRAKRGLIEMWANNSGEAVDWLIRLAKEAGAQAVQLGNEPHQPLLDAEKLHLTFTTLLFGPKPYNTGRGMQDISQLAAKKGVDIFYETPAKQLIQDESGKVTGVIGQTVDGKYIQFNAAKGILMATGDYANDADMMHHYLPDMDYFERKRFAYTGDGHKMIVWAGGRMENVGHTKMAHDMDSGPNSMMSAPFLRVKLNGKRFCDETVGMEYMNCYLNSKEDSGHYCQIFDSTYEEQGRKRGFTTEPKDSLKKWMPEEDVPHVGVVEPLIATYKADTLEELAQKLGIKDIPTFLQTVQHYNNMAGAGRDTEMGMDADMMCPILKGPFYGTHRHIRFTVACSGIEVNERLQVLNDANEPIEGLYAAGTLAGNFYGSADYPLDVFGINLGHNYTEGYVVAQEMMGVGSGEVISPVLESPVEVVLPTVKDESSAEKNDTTAETLTTSTTSGRYACTICGYIYDDAKEAIPFKDLPDDWTCPNCGVPKNLFDKIN